MWLVVVVTYAGLFTFQRYAVVVSYVVLFKGGHITRRGNPNRE